MKFQLRSLYNHSVYQLLHFSDPGHGYLLLLNIYMTGRTYNTKKSMLIPNEQNNY